MDNISWRHHYLPVFYLKGFSKNGKIKVYDVEKKTFVQGGKEFSPKSYFFEKNGNIIRGLDSEKDDFIEKFYANFDNKMAEIITRINSSNDCNRYHVTEEEMPIINHFVSLMYWRLPHKKEELMNIITNNDLSTLGLNVFNSNGTINEIQSEKIKNDDSFPVIYKIFTSFMDSIRGFNCRTPYRISEKYYEFPYLCSDNPVIFEKDNYPNVYEDDYIFPLSGTRIFTKAPKPENVNPIMVDILLYKQAKKYVTCTDERYIEMLDNCFNMHNMTVKEYKAECFKLLR
ncbi:DUF4238 domain-containing protein [Myroides odoratimimus]|uniref:DUF4238 domain-containing protein n=1 Tax=Myroides odoratimimus TaxID=76832 RepID=UPI002DBC3814|nr:DUF4238 domain-containing protein [Myroides odoratimimus]MEC4086241.1 DUF4238 domain-containing protein [Myroides odoratimimus]